jgi:Na+/H+ antiporter NhaA
MRRESPLRDYLRTETGSAAFLLAATVAALLWVNVDAASYERVWQSTLSIRLGGHGIAQDVRHWVNAGLMTFFFFVVGLEARRELDMGELRERRRVALPLLAGIGGMAVPVAIYLAFNAGKPSAHGWGVTMSTDTAFALGMLALVARNAPDGLRAFLLTVVVVDDIVALVVIATVYSDPVVWSRIAIAAAIFAVIVAVRAAAVRVGIVYMALGVAAWVAVFESGIDPIVVGLLMGLLVYAVPASRGDLERATDLFRMFREQPTAELQRSARLGLQSAVPLNDRLQELYHPWTSYAIVPLFALANAGIPISRDFLTHAYTSPLTLGIVLGYVLGKPAGVLGVSALVTRLSGGRLRPPVGWGAVAGGGAVAGIGFTVALLIANQAFRGVQLEQAKLGILTAALLASICSWLVFRGIALMPKHLRVRALLGRGEPLVDLVVPFDPERDHVRGPAEALVTVLEYGDFECPFCGQAEPVVRELFADFIDVQYVWRHLPLHDVHPRAQAAAEAAEAAAEQDAFWEMHDLLLDHQDALRLPDLIGYADELGLDADRFRSDLKRHAGNERIEQDVASADLSGVSGTPTFFINGRRHYGAYDLDTLSTALRAAGARAVIASKT